MDEIAYSKAGTENLGATQQAVVECIEEARANSRHSICFVSGVPGSGKTLAGLKAVAMLNELSASSERTVFLSGNGPLVRVLREALKKNKIALRGIKRSDRKAVQRETEAFIQDMHRFAKDEFGSSDPPSESVIVFDEAQRAWSKERNEKKTQRAISEAEMILEIMERQSHWAVIVAIIGSGQEIHEGEAGVEAWFDALDRRDNWDIWIPSRFASDLHAISSDRVRVKPELHLNVSRRSHTSELTAEWVDLVLGGNQHGAKQIADRSGGLPVFLARDITSCKEWLQSDARSHKRYGLVASSGAVRLRAYGIEPPTFSFLQRVSYENWFLADKADIRSSFQLEVAMSEFEMQGLEIDRVCMCWGGDLVWKEKENRWMTRRFHGSKWLQVHESGALGADCLRTRLLNKYRVLMTRYRHQMVIFVPPGSLEDRSNSQVEFDATAAYLTSCGARPI